MVGAFATDGAGLAVDRSFDPFGQPLASAGGTLRVGFQGSWTDPATAKVSAQARWYTPGTGGFVSRDSFDVPFSGGGSANRYLYATETRSPTTTRPASRSNPFGDLAGKIGEATEESWGTRPSNSARPAGNGQPNR